MYRVAVWKKEVGNHAGAVETEHMHLAQDDDEQGAVVEDRIDVPFFERERPDMAARKLHFGERGEPSCCLGCGGACCIWTGNDCPKMVRVD